jgi:hypothetical protein
MVSRGLGKAWSGMARHGLARQGVGPYGQDRLIPAAFFPLYIPRKCHAVSERVHRVGMRMRRTLDPPDTASGLKRVTSVALCDRWLSVDFRYPPFANEVMRRCKMS